MSILVHGTAGCIGSRLSEALMAAGEPSIRMDSFGPLYDSAAKERNLASLRASGRFVGWLESAGPLTLGGATRSPV